MRNYLLIGLDYSLFHRCSRLTYYLLTCLLTACNRVFIDKLTSFKLAKKFSEFYGTRRFITPVTSARHMSLSWPSSTQSIIPTSHFLKIDLNIILPSTPGSPKWSLSFRFPHQNPVYASPLSHMRYMPRPSHSSLFYHTRCSRLGAEIFRVCRISVFCVQTFRRMRWRRNWPVSKSVGSQDNRNMENHWQRYSNPRSLGFLSCPFRYNDTYYL